MGTDHFDEHAYSKTMRALSAPIRFKILNLLRAGELSVGEISSRIDQETTSISFHLRTLMMAGLIGREERGRTHLYSLLPSVFRPGDHKTRPDRLDLGYCQLELP